MADAVAVLRAWETAFSDVARVHGFTPTGYAAAVAARAMGARIAELGAVGGLAPLPGQVLDDQTVDAIDARHAALAERVGQLEETVAALEAAIAQ